MGLSELKYIALFLPQFHSIPENDEWWGENFTDWTNTRPMQPFFDGHYQPHEPSEEIGYYDLNDVSVMIKQAEMARQYGIYGFCYYYYWFNGKKLLEKPLENMLHEPKVKLPFCLCWANHNWTRRWDGLEEEMLIEQTYDEDTYTRFIDDLYPYFRDSRYIRIDAKPVLLIYQAEKLKNPREATRIWREHAKKAYGIDLFLICVHQSSKTNPNDFGYDAAVAFTPEWRSEDVLSCSEHPTFYDNTVDATLIDYRKNTLSSCIKKTEEYLIFRCVYPMWDNSSRRKKKGAVIVVNNSPDLFKRFLLETSKNTVQQIEPSKRFIFINAWNEWAEGTHLEPCKKYGFKFLEICKEVSCCSEEELFQQGFTDTEIEWLSYMNAKFRIEEKVNKASISRVVIRRLKEVLKKRLPVSILLAYTKRGCSR